MSFSRMRTMIDAAHRESGTPKSIIFFDMILCAVRYNIGYLDYKVFGFAKIRGKNRRTFMTMNHNLSLVRKLNDPKYYEVFDDKLIFNRRFGEFIRRSFIDLRECTPDGLREFCSGRETVFAKQPQTFGGQGISRVRVSEVEDYGELYGRLCENKQYLVEETIVQHEEMNRLCPTSVNTVRIVTLVVDSQPHFMYALVRMGNGRGSVDNISSGGLYTPVNGEGLLTKPAFCDKTGEYYDCHPVSGTRFEGFRIPFFDEAVQMCKRAALVEPHMRYIGWDAAITPDGPLLVEGNNFPSYDMVQNHRHIDGNTGILPLFEKTIGDKI